jgi:hypothetical protein
MACYGDSFTFLYIDHVRTSQETRLWSSMSCYGDRFIFLYVDDDCISQETYLGSPRRPTLPLPNSGHFHSDYTACGSKMEEV